MYDEPSFSMAESPADLRPGEPPLILFDGVCNLCDASVRWIIERDPRRIFRFASLQSAAGRAALAGSGATVPPLESVVLIDRAGTHTRSDAAIRIARRLGLPWSAVALALLVPRPLRDAGYRWVARNRYGWFGRRESCLRPTPELAGLFLDAGEPAETLRVQDPPPEATAKPAGLAGFLLGFAKRFVLALFFLLIFPFPIWVIPGSDRFVEIITNGQRAAVVWAGRMVFGLSLTIFPGGSGDTTYNYVELFLYAASALMLALIGSMVARGRPVSPRVTQFMQSYVRCFLAATLLSYGWTKLIPLQFGSIGPDSMVVSYGESSPMGLLWRFMAASTVYQMFTGLAELSAGVLLLVRRTMLPGAILAAAVLTNIALLNFCFDVPVKIFSVTLLCMSVSLILPDAMRLVGVSVLNLPVQPASRRPFAFRNVWVRRLAVALYAVFVFLVAVYPVFQSIEWWQEEARTVVASPVHGVFGVEGFETAGVSGRDVPDSARWVRVGMNAVFGRMAIRRADGSGGTYGFELVDNGGKLRVTRRGETAPIGALRFQRTKAGLIELEGDFEGRPTRVVLRRRPDDENLLNNRGFHWINERPFNR